MRCVQNFKFIFKSTIEHSHLFVTIFARSVDEFYAKGKYIDYSIFLIKQKSCFLSDKIWLIIKKYLKRWIFFMLSNH